MSGEIASIRPSDHRHVLTIPTPRPGSRSAFPEGFDLESEDELARVVAFE